MEPVEPELARLTYRDIIPLAFRSVFPTEDPAAVDSPAAAEGATKSLRQFVSLAWPVLGNYQVFIRDRRGTNYNWWIDDSQPPEAARS